jgi:hypothetical protein
MNQMLKILKPVLRCFTRILGGLLNKSEELISSLSPDFLQVLCLTKHHLRHFEIDFRYTDQYKLGAKFCRDSYKSGGVSILVHDNLQCTNINLDEFCKEQDIESYAIYTIKFSASQPSQF